MQGLSTQACETFGVLEVLKSKDGALQQDSEEESSTISTLSSLQLPTLLTIALPCGNPHVGEVEEVEKATWPEVEGEQSSPQI